jgi:hypothetical protein
MIYVLILTPKILHLTINVIIVQQAVQCVYIFLCPFINYIIFFLQLCLSFQSSSTNPFSPVSPPIPSAQVHNNSLISFKKNRSVVCK